MKTTLFFSISCLVLAVTLCSCQTTEPLLEPEAAVPPSLAKKGDLVLFETHLFTAPDDFELLKNTKDNHIAGVFSPQDGDRLVKRLKRRQNFELLSTPSVTARQGQRAVAELIREMIYPIEFDPPKMGKVDPESGKFPVTPTTATKFEKKNVGITAAFKGRSTSGGGVNVEFDIKQVNFLGFINYGSPITAMGEDARGNPTQIILSENKIEQPVFGEKRLSSAITLANGHYVAVGGLRKDSQKNMAARTRSNTNVGGLSVEEDKNLFALIKVTAVKRN